jgi:CMP-N-acetylneuraminic acid synthetase
MPLGSVVALLPIQQMNAKSFKSNFAMMAGKPLFAWVLETLLAVPQIDRIVINTDAEFSLARSGIRLPAHVTVRPRADALCGENVSINAILADDIAAIPADTYLMTHTTNPLLRASTITDALARFEAARSSGAADSLFSVSRIQARLYGETGVALNHDPADLQRTSTLAPYFEENSNLYLFDRTSFDVTGGRIGAKPQMFETPRMESYSAQARADWFLTESMARRIKAGEALESQRP